MKRLVQWRKDIQKWIETSYQIYAAILLQRNIGENKFWYQSFHICANFGAWYCATPDKIYCIPDTYKYLTGLTINGISERIKAAGCGSFSWIFQDDKKENIEIIIEQVFHIPGLPIRIIFPQQVGEQSVKIVDGLHDEKDEAHLIFGGLKFTT